MIRSRGGASANEPKLIALLEGSVVGAIHRDARARYRFVYDDAWRLAEDSYPLSLSMPLTATEHPHAAVEAFLWGLLPDDERTLDHYARTFGVSARNPLAMLEHLGADCAGAVQLVAPAHIQELAGPPTAAEVEWIDDAEIAQELRSAKETGLPGKDRRTVGRFSLAGAQPKIALYLDQERWGRPQGRTPTTHILKPPSGAFEHFAENEHLCLALAAELGLRAARSRVRSFDGEAAIVVERFDRRTTGASPRRVHQEDLCQAMGVLPWNKYESQGGPGIRDIIPLIRESSREPDTDVGRFIDMVALNWVLAAPDAHAKNYAFLHARGGEVRLAPFYDVISYLPYADRRLSKIKMAMRIGTEYVVRKVAQSDWTELAAASKESASNVLGRLDALLPRIPHAVQRVAARAIDDGLSEKSIAPLAERIIERSRECRERLARRAPSDPS